MPLYNDEADFICDERHWQLGDKRDDNSLSVSIVGIDKYNSYPYVDIEVDEPWAGSTETGFGRTSSIQISPTRAIDLANWILANVKE